MNPNQTMHSSPQWLAAMAARGFSPAGEKASRVTIGGVWIFLIGLTIFLSGIAKFRLPVFNLHIQPYLILVAMALPMVLMRSGRFPIKVLAGLLIFWTLYAISLIGPSVQRVTPLEDAIKLGSSVAVVIVAALLVSSRADFVLGSAGLALAIGVLAFRGLEEEQAGIIDSAVANKNSYSMYALPAVLLALFIALRVDWKKVSFRKLAVPVMLVCTLASSIAIVAGANRSGDVGLALIVLMMGLYLVFSSRLHLGRKSQGAILLMSLVAAVVIGLAYKGTEVLARRYEQTVEGTESDRLRVHLFVNSLEIGLEHPVRGVSPQVLPVKLAERLFPDQPPGLGIETHNVFAHIIGGCGFFTMAALIYVAWTLCFWRPRNVRWPAANVEFYDARTLLRMMIILWGVRGLFSQEILYNPGFCMGLGLAIGLCVVEFELLKKSAPPGYPAMRQMVRPFPARS
jgi:hypothetical protein